MTKVICGECQQSYSKMSNLRAHVVKKKHPGKHWKYTQTVFNYLFYLILDLIKVLAPKKNGVSGTFLCLECKRNFTNVSNLKAHVKGKHPGMHKKNRFLVILYFYVAMVYEKGEIISCRAGA